MQPIRSHRVPWAAAALGIAALLLLVGIGWGRLRLWAPGRPDIVLIVWDTCRGDRTTVGGYDRPTTPRLEAFAARGVVFRNAFTPSPWTPPAHASIFTGLLPRRHGLREGPGDRVGTGIPLLAETLAGAGYETVAIVANPHLSPTTGLLAGFSRIVECRTGAGGPGTGDEAAAAVEGWLAGRPARSRDRPLFLFVNLMDCHLRYRFEDAAVAAVRGDAAVNDARRAALEVTGDIANRHLYGALRIEDATLAALDAAYDGAVRLVDRSTGRVLDALEGAGLLEEALVAVTGDHGENLGEHGEMSHVMSVHEPVLRVPLVLVWPGRLEEGGVEEAQVRTQDLYPTLLEAAGVPVPPPCGRDAVSLLASPLESRILVAEYGPADGLVPGVLANDPTLAAFMDRFHRRWVAVREPSELPGARKLLLHSRIRGEGNLRAEREELFDLNADPGEFRNLLEGQPRDFDRSAADRLREYDR